MRTCLAILILLVQSLAWASTLTLTYDPAGRLVDVNYGGTTNTVSSFDNNGNLVSQSTFVSADPDLTIVQSASPAPVTVGTPLQYTVSLLNNSALTAKTVTLNNTLPANASLLSNSVTLGSVTQTGNVLAWSIARLTNNTSAALTFTVLPTAIGPLTNTAIVTESLIDAYGPDNTNSLVTFVVSAPIAAGTVLGNGSVVISWPLAGGGNFTVEYTDSLMPPVIWTPLPVTPAVSGDSFYIQDTPPNTHRFYRLVSH